MLLLPPFRNSNNVAELSSLERRRKRGPAGRLARKITRKNPTRAASRVGGRIPVVMKATQENAPARSDRRPFDTLATSRPSQPRLCPGGRGSRGDSPGRESSPGPPRAARSARLVFLWRNAYPGLADFARLSSTCGSRPRLPRPDQTTAWHHSPLRPQPAQLRARPTSDGDLSGQERSGCCREITPNLKSVVIITPPDPSA